MWLKWLPWRLVVRRVAKAHGFLDPIALLGRLQRFTQPSEVAEPIELLRAGAMFHARGLINSRVIQHNLDWVWPYWIERQFDPSDVSFIPRAFSITHVNLTHRNWTTIGLPGSDELPIVDPRGLLTPFWDGWSIDAFLMDDARNYLLPSRAPHGRQELHFDESELFVTTTTASDPLLMTTTAKVVQESGRDVCQLQIQSTLAKPHWIVVALRPYNPEGISFIQKVSLSGDRETWHVDDTHRVQFSRAADRHHVSGYAAGDVYIHLKDREDQQAGACDVGLVTAAALFRIPPDDKQGVGVTIPLAPPQHGGTATIRSWSKSMTGHCQLRIPDAKLQFLYDAALRTLLQHAPHDVYPGPYTYKRFWFRDAAFIVHGLLCAGFFQQAKRALSRFPERQDHNGYFHSQEGEWDANGEALWIMHRYQQLSGETPPPEWWPSIKRAAAWITNKRLPDDGTSLHGGLLPAGFSAEHLGPSDYYYWDDFWGIAGLKAASQLAVVYGDPTLSASFASQADDFQAAVNRSHEKVQQRLGRLAIPASPHRRMDAGAIGSIAAGYPLQLYHPTDPRLIDTTEFLLANCFHHGGFFQDMIHSGINAYLTLHIAQVLLRAADPRYIDLLKTVANLASPTGQWPEAIHPQTGGGCMGDGQHVWAAAEWILMLRNCFVREESDKLLLAGGVPDEWIQTREVTQFGPAPTNFGPVTLTITPRPANNAVRLSWEANWYGASPSIEIRLPAKEAVPVPPGENSITIPYAYLAQPKST